MADFKINEQIPYPKLRVIGERGENLGVLSREDAQTAANNAGLDLIVITEKADPPVARITSFDKLRYQQEKELKKQQRQKAPDTKRIQISPRAAKNDLMVKMKRLEGFLADGHRVEIQLVMKGREKANKDWARGKLEEFMGMIESPHKVSQEIKAGGRGFIAQIEPLAQK